MCPDDQRSAFSFGGEQLGCAGTSGISPGACAPGRSRAQTARSRRRVGRAPLLAGLGVAVLAAVAVAIAAAGGGGGGGTSPQSAALTQAAYVTGRAPGMRFAMMVTASVGEHHFGFESQGSIDEQRAEGVLSMSIAGQQVKEIIKNPYVYVQLPSSATALTGGKPWARANVASYSQSMGMPNPFDDNGTPTQTLQMLDASGEVSKLGGESVDGVATTHYHAVVSFSRYAAQAPGAQRAAIVAEGKLISRLTGSSSLPLDVWVDAQDRVRRLNISMNVCTPAGTLTETIDMRLYDFAPQPVVTVPPESEVSDVSSSLDSRSSKALEHLGCG
jgi:hypothetical protein